uniref:Uncharacterized protein n=1 Tax=Siphoviridae sp. ctnPP24 TaxID=2825662 RepID=A0A8S5TZ02_9CAUD|nr:MAG TPA: hypothetical protein [Siphoviridae sp. ctnPP24]
MINQLLHSGKMYLLVRLQLCVGCTFKLILSFPHLFY